MGYIPNRVHKSDIAHHNDKMDTRGCLGCTAREKSGTCKFADMFGVTRALLKAPTYPGGGCRLKRDKDGNPLEVKPIPQEKSDPVKPREFEWDTEKALKLHEEGAYDKDIAQQLGISTSSVHRWRKGLGLPPNKGRRLKDGTLIDWNLAEKLYAEGLNDVQIAKQLGEKVTHGTVRDWRLRTNKPANQPRSNVW